MGVYNSSLTRVVPFFDYLVSHDPTGCDWLTDLLKLGSRASEVLIPADVGTLAPDHPRWWGNNERRLEPPTQLLEWLIANVTEHAVSRSGDTGETLRKRHLLSQKDIATTKEAMSLVRRPAEGREWFRLEGQSCPDACLQTERILLVVEGKRTERACTSKTKWMGRRSQLVRHMDAALEVAGGRKVFGLLIVEPTDATPEMYPSPFWLEQEAEQRSPEMLTRSLPHRTPQDRERLANGMLGVTTWQRACQQLGVSWPLSAV